MTWEAVLRSKCAQIKALHGDRRRAGTCIQNGKHGKAHAGGRCFKCWKRKLAAERVAYAAKKTKMRTGEKP